MSLPILRLLAAPGGRAAGLRRAVLALALGGAAFGAAAQAYKIVGPDGRVTFTDKPPASADAPPPAGGGGAAAAGGSLPYETRQASAKYPATLYASKDCTPCDQARQWLRGRGIPYAEYSVSNAGDLAALKSRFGTSTLPVVTLGSQTIKGFNSGDLQSYADAAGYPAQARLAGYAWPAAVPLAPAPAAAAAPKVPAASVPASTPSLIPPPSRSGIQF
jgi:glutaredoxin